MAIIMTININSEDTAWVARDLYCKTPEALKLAHRLHKTSFDFKTTLYILSSMKTTVMSIKVSEDTKKRAQIVAKQFGLPLSTLVNAYLMELGDTGQIHFSTTEMMTPRMEKIIEQADKEIKDGNTSGPFNSAEEAISYLKSL